MSTYLSINYGDYYNVYTYEGWSLITDSTSQQYALREQAGENYDDEGFGIIEGCYVIACTRYFGEIGDYVDFILASGETLHCIIGDFKSSQDENYGQYGHIVSGVALNVIEFIVDYDTWYPSHTNPGVNGFHEEWAGKLQYAINLGNFFDGYEPSDGSTGEEGEEVGNYIIEQGNTLFLVLSSGRKIPYYPAAGQRWIKGIQEGVTPTPTPTTATGQKLVDWCYSKAGQWNYVFGGSRTDPDSTGGTDCSGMITAAFYQVLNIYPDVIGSWTGSQWTNSNFTTILDSTTDFSAIPWGDMLPGDLIFTASSTTGNSTFSTGSGSHVGFYTGTPNANDSYISCYTNGCPNLSAVSTIYGGGWVGVRRYNG